MPLEWSPFEMLLLLQPVRFSKISFISDGSDSMATQRVGKLLTDITHTSAHCMCYIRHKCVYGCVCVWQAAGGLINRANNKSGDRKKKKKKHRDEAFNASKSGHLKAA